VVQRVSILVAAVRIRRAVTEENALISTPDRSRLRPSSRWDHHSTRTIREWSAEEFALLLDRALRDLRIVHRRSSMAFFVRAVSVGIR